jgi:hypothetical protein
MTSNLKIAQRAALSAATLFALVTAASAGESGYFDTAGAPLVSPSHYESDAAQSTAERQQASGYFASADAPLVAPNTSSLDAATTLAKQRASSYFPEADSPLR